MDLETFITTVFCLTDDLVRAQPQKLRQRGPAPTVADSEVLTLVLVGEFLGLSTDQGIYRYFRRHHGAITRRSSRPSPVCIARRSSARRPTCGA